MYGYAEDAEIAKRKLAKRVQRWPTTSKLTEFDFDSSMKSNAKVGFKRSPPQRRAGIDAGRFQCPARQSWEYHR